MVQYRSTTRLYYLAIIFLIILGAAALAAPIIAPFSPTSQDLDNRFLSSGLGHLLGTDNVGRDILSRIIIIYISL